MDNPYENYEIEELCKMSDELDYELEAAKRAQREINEKLFYLNYKQTLIYQAIGGRPTIPADLVEKS